MSRAIFDRLKKEQWTVVEEWISEKQPETLNLDFKTKSDANKEGLGGHDKKNIAKTLSAFANTEGGLLILGIATTKTPKDEPDRADRVQPIKQIAKFLQAFENHQRELTVPPIAGLDPIPIEDT